MNYFTLIFNRVYFFLTKIKNQSPFLGTVILVTLLLNSFINNLLLMVYAFRAVPLRTNSYIYFLGLGILFIILYFYAKKRRSQIARIEINASVLKNVLVSTLFIFVFVFFVVVANINREKLSKEKKEILAKPKKDSLESKIRKWFQ